MTVEANAAPVAAPETKLDPTELRRQRGLAIAALCPIKPEGKDNRYRVPSQSNGRHRSYLVSIDPKKGPDWQCECADYDLRKLPCKHVFAVQFVIEREKNANGDTITTKTLTVKERAEYVGKTVAERTIYKRDWRSINLASTNEKGKFQGLLRDLCKGIPQPQKADGTDKGGQRRLSLADMVFAVAFKVYSTLSGRRFMCDLSDAQGRGYIDKVPHFNSIFNYLESEELTPILVELIGRSAMPLRTVETVFAVDSSGFTTSGYVRWYDQKYGVVKREHTWVKAHLICGVKTNVVTASFVGNQFTSDCPQFASLLKETARRFIVREVSADAAYCSYDNFEAVAALGGTAYIGFPINANPIKSGTEYAKMFHYYGLNRDEYLAFYHKRSNVESTFSMIKAKFGSAIRSKTEVAMWNEALCKILCHNVCRVIQSTYELGINPVFWEEDTEATTKPEPRPIEVEDSTGAWDWV